MSRGLTATRWQLSTASAGRGPAVSPLSVMGRPTFYFTLGPSDLSRQRLVPGSHGMLVASSLWRNGRLAVRRPPVETIRSLALDSGGFVAARRWGCYPWTPAQYVAWIKVYQQQCPLDFCATMDYACERSVDRTVYQHNRQRIRATVELAQRCRDLAPELPWLPVVQGSTLAEYGSCYQAYQQAGFALAYLGLGTMCGRVPAEAITVVRTLRQTVPETRWHVFGMSLRVLRDAEATDQIRSWDSYAWNWGTGAKGDACRETRQAGESYSQYTGRLAHRYAARIHTLLQQPRQLALF